MAVLNNSALVGASGKGGTGAITTPQRSLRFNSADSSFLSRTPAAGNRKTWTWSGWIKKVNNATSRQFIFNADTNSFNSTIEFKDNAISVFDYNAGYQWQVITSAVFRDNSSWMHLVVALDTTQAAPADRVKVYANGIQQTFSTANYPSPDYQSKFNLNVEHRIGSLPGDTTFNLDGYLANIHFIDGQALTPSAFAYTDPVTGRWEPKAYAGSYSGNSFYLDFSDNSAATATTLGADRSGLGNNWVPNNLNATAAPYFYPPSGGGGLDQYIPAGWTRTNNPSDVLVNNQTGVLVNQNGALMFAIKPTSSSITIKWIVYDGSGTYTPNVVLNTSSSWSNTLIGPSSVSGNGSTGSPSVGTYSVTAGTTYYVSTYGQGNPALVVYATNVTIEPIGTSASGIDSLRDHPVSAGIDGGLGGQVSGNYCTFNPLNSTSSYLSNGNLTFIVTSGIGWQNMNGTFGVSSGKWYCEVTATAKGNTIYGITRNPVSTGFTAGDGYFIDTFGNAYGGMGTPNSTISNGDVIGYALNLDTNSFTLYKNNSLLCTASISAGTYFVYLGGYYNYGNIEAHANFGARPFAFPAPAGFKCLCDQNLPTPLIARPSTAMDVVTYVGDGNSTRTISGLQFSPDLVWTKSRNQGYGQNWFDTVRGAGNVLRSDIPNSELNNSSEGYLSAFNSDGYTMSAGSNTAKNGNELNTTYVGWAWDAGASTVTNNNGSISSQVRANPSTGFSIVTFTGSSGNQSIGHGLSAVPQLIVLKYRNGASGWYTYHGAIASGNNKLLTLNSANAADGSANYWNNTAPTSTVFTIGSDLNTTNTWVAYCFAPVANYSAFGSYLGTGTSPNYVHLGFRPALVIIKNVGTNGSPATTNNWLIQDSKRSAYNQINDVLYPNLSNAESTIASNFGVDFLSNGFALRTTGGYFTNSNNASEGHTFVYAAWAESPFKYARAR